MKPEELLNQLETLSQNMAIDLRYEKGDFKGGLCRVNEQKILIINSKLPDDEKIKIFTNELSQMDLDNIYVVPAVREVLEEQAKNLEVPQQTN